MNDEMNTSNSTREGDTQEASSAGKSRLPRLLMTVGLLIPILAFSAFASRMLVKKMFFPTSAPEKKEKTEKDALGEFYMIEDLVVNPAATGGRRHLLVSLGLEYHDPLLKEELTRRDPQIRDNLITLLAGQEVSVLANIQYRENIRQALLDAVNYYLTEGKVARVYFVKYVFQ
jgi:flagellar FliL protein